MKSEDKVRQKINLVNKIPKLSGQKKRSNWKKLLDRLMI